MDTEPGTKKPQEQAVRKDVVETLMARVVKNMWGEWFEYDPDDSRTFPKPGKPVLVYIEDCYPDYFVAACLDDDFFDRGWHVWGPAPEKDKKGNDVPITVQKWQHIHRVK